ncbi:nucleotide sugar dehydrogenase [uncultured Alistipes sp.]|uniref:nucleotide sugar dehydrogenase n=1 Tax=uncultured Alistipes sp. TaxID=538949 RepID=UPI002608B431|nr:nucleotide sugar dehydrogenase [uncultured Alistipes sp.]
MDASANANKSDVHGRLTRREAAMAVVGLGYVGWPLARHFSRHFRVIGYDIDPRRIERLRNRAVRSGALDGESFGESGIVLTSSSDDLSEAVFYIVAVPTPVDEEKRPDLAALDDATRRIASHLKPGDYVVYESTVYPGCTQERCIPMLERLSGLAAGVDFKVGYSPERINPGDEVHSLSDTVKIVSGCDAEALDTIARMYGEVVEAGLHRVPDMKVAETAKLLENIQRDVNIALMNECAGLSWRLGVDFGEVLAAASTKWNFAPYSPGLVGGHCIGVDPYYLLAKAGELDMRLPLIRTSRQTNEAMGRNVADILLRELAARRKAPQQARILLMGFTYKENVSDIRNTKSMDLFARFAECGAQVDIADPHADEEDVRKAYGVKLVETLHPPYDMAVVAVAHDEYRRLDEAFFRNILSEGGLLADLHSVCRHRVRSLDCWSL